MVGILDKEQVVPTVDAENQVYVENSIETVALEDSDNESQMTVLNPVVSFVMERFERAKVKRQSDENRWLMAYRNYRGIYGPDVAFTDTEKSRVFIKVTKTKVLAAFAQIVEVLFAGNKFPIGVEATPVPNGDLAESVYVDAKEPQGQDSTGMVVRPELLGPFREFLSSINDKLKMGTGKTPTSATWEPTKEAAKKMEKKIHDQLEESDAAQHLRYSAFEFCLFGSGVMKGPFAYKKEYPKWAEDGTYQPKFENIPKINSVSIWDFYPDPEGLNMNDVDFTIERHKLTRDQLRQLNKRPFFMEEAIDAAIMSGPDYLPEYWESILEDNAAMPASERYQVLEYWGLADRQLIEDSGIDIPDNLDEDDQINVNIWICNSQVIRLIINPFKPVRIPYHVFPYELNPYSFFGIGVAENMDDTQMLMNGFMRMAVDNAVLSGNVILEMDETALVPGQSLDVYPGKVFRRQSGAPGQALFGIKYPNVSQELLMLYDKARQLTDEATSMPSYAHGGLGVNGMGRTAAGMSMLMGAAAQSIKANVRNIDDYLLLPLGRALFAFNMQFNFDKEFIGDLDIVAKGTESLMRNEVRSQKLMQFMQLTANPIDAPFVKRDYVLREFAASLDLDEDKMFNDPRQALIQALTMRQMQEAQGIQPGQNQPKQQGSGGPPSPSDPTGNGGGTIGPGAAPEPNMAGYTGAGGGNNGGANGQSTRTDSAAL